MAQQQQLPSHECRTSAVVTMAVTSPRSAAIISSKVLLMSVKSPSLLLSARSAARQVRQHVTHGCAAEARGDHGAQKKRCVISWQPSFSRTLSSTGFFWLFGTLGSLMKL